MERYVCLDPRPLNQAVKRQHYHLPTAHEIFLDMKDATVFSKLDASSDYWQIPVDDKTSDLLTFATSFGRFKFKRMPYWSHLASEVFQQAVKPADLQDDIII